MTEEEFRQKVMPLRRQMYGIALRMGIPPDDAADVVQETQIRLWRRRDGIPEDPPQLRLYCLAAARNECLTMIRLSKTSVGLDEIGDIRSDDYDKTEYKDTRHRVEILIDSLPRGQREAIRLSAFGACDNSEIAEALGQTENNVRQLLSRGRRKLREMLSI